MMGQKGKGNLPLEIVKFLGSRIKTKGLTLLQNTPLMSKDQQVPLSPTPKLEQMDAFTSHLYSIFHDSLLPTLLRNFDRYSMIASMETRMPLMDHRLVTFAFSLPWTSKLRNGYSKAILRDATQSYMPLSVNTRKPKIGFSSPVTHWMRNEWKAYLLDTIHSQEFNECNLITPALLTKRIEAVLAAKHIPHSQGQDVWHYFSTFLWYKTFYKALKKEMPR
jgi:asparagine synthase (glutamine-hydrolysing)